MPTPSERRLALRSALYAARSRVRMSHYRPAGRGLLVLLALLDGTVQQLRVTTGDHPELGALTERERGGVRAPLFTSNGGEEHARASIR